MLDSESQKLYNFDVSKIDINDYALGNASIVMRQWFEKQQIRRKQRKAHFEQMKTRLNDLKMELKDIGSQCNIDNKNDTIILNDENGNNILNESCSSMRSLLNTANQSAIDAISREAGHKVSTDFDESNSELETMARLSKRKQIWQIISRMGLTVGGVGFSHFGISLMITITFAWVIFRRQ